MSRPENLHYSSTHEWIRVEENVAVVGITDFAVEQLSDLVFIELPAVDDSVEREGAVGEIESTKTVSDLFAPVSGKIVAINSEVVDNLDLVKDSPFESGWLFKIEMTNPTELEELLSDNDYDKQLESEHH